uniref:Uncharacterized protein n=1 Tax=Cannabis sativa TaxID=3483 RepID=A0A803PCB4_CANSA
MRLIWKEFVEGVSGHSIIKFFGGSKEVKILRRWSSIVLICGFGYMGSKAVLNRHLLWSSLGNFVGTFIKSDRRIFIKFGMNICVSVSVDITVAAKSEGRNSEAAWMIRRRMVESQLGETRWKAPMWSRMNVEGSIVGRINEEGVDVGQNQVVGSAGDNICSEMETSEEVGVHGYLGAKNGLSVGLWFSGP